MMMKTVLASAAAVIALGVSGVSAATIGGSGWSGDPFCDVTGSSASTRASIDVVAGAAFNSQFDDGEAAGHMCFNLHNSSTSAAAVTLAVATVNQGGTSWGFRDGVSLDSEQLGHLWTVAAGVGAVNSFTFNIAANDTKFFDWSYGEAYASSDLNKPQINFTVGATVVPVPAAGFLLLGGLGALAAVGRRRRKAKPSAA